jgi:Uma2 family endonuclease
MATATGLMTVDEFRKLQNPPGAYYELRNGETIAVTYPKQEHDYREDRLLDLLVPLSKGHGRVSKRFAFRALPEYELRQADVAYISAARYRGMNPDDNLHGAPDLVIEVLSPSNTADEMEEKAALCLENGSLEFWVVRPRARTVTVYTAEGGRRLYRSGDAIPLGRFFPGSASIPVNEIFAEPEI